MQVDINGLRKNVASSFNALYQEFDPEHLTEDQTQAFELLRQAIAFCLLTHFALIGMDELDPDKLLVEVTEEES